MKAILVLFAIIGLSVGAPKPHGLVHSKFSPRTLADDFQDFVDLLPLDDIKAIADDHLNTDGALAVVVIYLQGPEWADLVDTVTSMRVYQDLVRYLTDAGLPVIDIIQWIHDLLAGPASGLKPDGDGSLRPFLDEIEAILPILDLLRFLNDKLQNSPDFQDLYVKISSEDFHALFEEVRAIPEVQRMGQRLRDFGVKVDDALMLIYVLNGWGTPKNSKITPRDLADDLEDFVNLLPLDDIKT